MISTWQWPYHFVPLTPAQIQERREMLDRRGQYAQLSALVPIVLVFLYQTFLPKNVNSQASNTNSKGKPQTRSWLDSPLFPGWAESKRQYLIIGLWTLWLLFVSTWKTGDDYLHLTKSLAHTTISQLPLHYLLSGGPILNLLLSPLLPGSPLKLNPYHRLHGALTLPLLLTLHGTLYLNFYIRSPRGLGGLSDGTSLIFKRIFDSDVQLGLLALSLLHSIAFAAVYRHVVTKLAGGYGVWWRAHVVFAGVFAGVVWVHVEWTRGYVLEAAGVWGVNLGVHCWKRWKR